MIEPSLKLLQASKKITVLGTQATIRSGLYPQKILKQTPEASVTSLACPSFVSLIEQGYANHPIAKITIHKALKTVASQETDAVLLACTHYPLIQTLIQAEFSKTTLILDPAIECALQAKHWLSENDLLNPQKTEPKHTFFVSGNTQLFSSLGTFFLQEPIHPILSAKTLIR